jgi:peptidoglycan hydrolase-like protein with peptidoglycan-binding domain
VKRGHLGRGGTLRILLLVCVLATLTLVSGAAVAGLEQPQAVDVTTTVTTEATTTAEASTTTTTEASTTTTEEPSDITEASSPTEASTTTTEAPVPTRYQQTDSRLSYLGVWSAGSSWWASGGSFYSTDATRAAVLVNFTGTSVSLLARTAPWYGKALVSLDGGADEYVDFYSSSTLYKQSVYEKKGLTDELHTLTIKRAGQKAGASSGYAICLDALDITGTLTQAPVATSYQQKDPNFKYMGIWSGVWTWSASGGSFIFADSRGASANVTFDGTYLAWYAKKGPLYGKAQVSLDGGAPVLVDLYSSYASYKQQVYSTGLLEYGSHTVSIHWIGQKNAASTGTLIDVDSFAVFGTLTAAPPAPPLVWRYQQSDYRLTYVGPWYIASTSAASGGSLFSTSVAKSAVLVNFTGTAVSLLARIVPWGGKALVSLDDGPGEYVDFYAPSTLNGQVVYQKAGLTNGPHTLVIKCAREKQGWSSGYAISLDALDVAGYVTQAQITNSPGGNQVDGLPKAEWFGLRLAQGSSGAAVAWLEKRLTDLSYRPGPIDGYFDAATRQAVIAFEKWYSLGRDGVVVGSMWGRLMSAKRPVPGYSYAGKWIEVSRQKQVLLYCVEGNVERTLAVSTGSARVGIITPSGLYHITRKNAYERVRYKPLYLTSTLLSIHGYTSVPTYPASHGCVRTTWADMDELNPLIPVGTTVRIY